MSPWCWTSVTASRYATVWTVICEELSRVTAYPFTCEKQWNCFSIRSSQISEKALLLWRSPGSARLSFWGWVWSIGGMILTGEKRSTGEKPVPVPFGPHKSYMTDLASIPWKTGAGEVNGKGVVIVLWREGGRGASLERLPDFARLSFS